MARQTSFWTAVTVSRLWLCSWADMWPLSTENLHWQEVR